jgi:hypothetical protein
LHDLLHDFAWIQAKLEAAELAKLIRDYDYLPDESVRRVQNALRLSEHVLSGDASRLAEQLLARLSGDESEDLAPLLSGARASMGAS